jgi:mitogen-activated protein kinase 15
MNQIERIIEVTGMPVKDDIEAISSPFAATMLESLPSMQYKSISQTFPTASPDALDLIKVCFHFNPEKRPSSEELLCHEYVTEFHNEEEEPVYPNGALILPIDDNTKLTAAQYR